MSSFTPSITCTCSTRIEYGEAGSPNSWFFFSEAEQAALPPSAGLAEFAAMMKHAVLCPNCRRLYVWWEKGKAPTEYVPPEEVAR
jgi:hypothetical protein